MIKNLLACLPIFLVSSLVTMITLITTSEILAVQDPYALATRQLREEGAWIPAFPLVSHIFSHPAALGRAFLQALVLCIPAFAIGGIIAGILYLCKARWIWILVSSQIIAGIGVYATNVFFMLSYAVYRAALKTSSHSEAIEDGFRNALFFFTLW